MNKFFAPLAAGIAVAGLIAFTALRPHAPQGSAVQVIAGIDASDSTRVPLPGGGHLLGRSIGSLARLGARLDRGRDRLTVFRVERETREFYDDLAPRSREKFQWLLIRHTKTAPAHKGTFPAKFWTTAATRAQNSTVPVVIAYLGDCDNDDLTATSRREMAAAARKLASNPAVREVSVYGANPKNWETLRRLLAPLDAKGILHLHPADEMSPTDLLDRVAVLRMSKSAPGASGKSSP